MRRRAVLATLALVAWVSGSVLGGLGPSDEARAASSGLAVGKAHAGYTPSLTGTKPVVILTVGSGARPGDDVMHSLADSIHLIFLNPAKQHAVIVGIPRDSYVSIAGGGTNKINASLVSGGPDGLVATVEAVAGVRIDYWAITTFWGLIGMVQRIGGITVDIPFSMHDSYSYSDFEPGVQRLTGDQALALTRDRHSLSQGDFGRTENGGRLLLAALAQFGKEYRTDPGRLFTWISAGMTNSITTMPLNEVMQLGFAATKVPVKNVQNVVLPGSSSSAGGLSIVSLNEGWRARIFNDAKADGILAKANVPPSPTAGE